MVNGLNDRQGVRLVIKIEPFKGLGRYEVDYGDRSVADVFVTLRTGDPSGFTYTNTNENPKVANRLTTAGAVTLSRLGRTGLRVYVGVPVIYSDESNRPKVIGLYGSAPCED